MINWWNICWGDLVLNSFCCKSLTILVMRSKACLEPHLVFIFYSSIKRWSTLVKMLGRCNRTSSSVSLTSSCKPLQRLGRRTKTCVDVKRKRSAGHAWRHRWGSHPAHIQTYSDLKEMVKTRMSYENIEFKKWLCLVASNSIMTVISLLTSCLNWQSNIFLGKSQWLYRKPVITAAFQSMSFLYALERAELPFI